MRISAHVWSIAISIEHQCLEVFCGVVSGVLSNLSGLLVVLGTAVVQSLSMRLNYTAGAAARADM